MCLEMCRIISSSSRQTQLVALAMLTQQQQQQQQIQHGRRLIFEKSKWATRWRRPGAVGAALIVVVSLDIIIRNSQ